MQNRTDAEMGQRYKNWMEALARYTVITFNVGKELAGERYIERVKEEFYKAGQRSVKHWRQASGVKEIQPELQPDCKGMGKLMDFIDDGYANFWDDYIENSPKAFEKEVFTCPIAEAWSRAPELCDVMLEASFQGMLDVLNPKIKFKGFSKLLPRGDKVCRYRMEMEE